jgi:hypothetical protein
MFILFLVGYGGPACCLSCISPNREWRLELSFYHYRYFPQVRGRPGLHCVLLPFCCRDGGQRNVQIEQDLPEEKRAFKCQEKHDKENNNSLL